MPTKDKRLLTEATIPLRGPLLRGKRRPRLVQRERQQDVIRSCHLFCAAHFVPRPRQRPARRRLPRVPADYRKPFPFLHARSPSQGLRQAMQGAAKM